MKYWIKGSQKLKFILHLGRLPRQEGAEQVDRQREDDRGVLLGADRVKRLQVAQLESRRRLRDHVGRLLQGARGLLLTLGSDDLRKIGIVSFSSANFSSSSPWRALLAPPQPPPPWHVEVAPAVAHPSLLLAPPSHPTDPSPRPKSTATFHVIAICASLCFVGGDLRFPFVHAVSAG